ncbi:MAG: glycoside hydrolase family 88 protein [Bacteroidota bacterium]
MPRNITNEDTVWNLSRVSNWTSGFWPGILWYIYDYTGEQEWLEAAQKTTAHLECNKNRLYKTHDLGFMMYNSFGHGYGLTNNPEYREILLESADSLAVLFNERAGTFLSWPWMIERKGWKHNTIINNMMNLNLLFWAGKSGRPEYYDLAMEHAANTARHFIRSDFSTWQVVVFDSATGIPVQKMTYKGLSDQSTWARGQAWAVYGYVMSYKETRDSLFLDIACGLADYFIENLPDDYIPYWDFDVTEKEQMIKDASAAAITASAIMDLCMLVPDRDRRNYFFNAGKSILKRLSSSQYKSKNKNHAFLDHSVGFFPYNSEIDVSIIYADYYYLEALIRYHKLVNNNTF